MKIMTVDDSSTMRKIIANSLKTLGYTDIVEAGDGSEALMKLEDNSDINVIFMDWNMPNMDGLTCLKKIREDARYEAIKVIMATTESEKKNVIEALQAGASNYVVKPFTPDVIKEKLEKVL